MTTTYVGLHGRPILQDATDWESGGSYARQAVTPRRETILEMAFADAVWTTAGEAEHAVRVLRDTYLTGWHEAYCANKRGLTGKDRARYQRKFHKSLKLIAQGGGAV